jgi:hypothetical protein
LTTSLGDALSVVSRYSLTGIGLLYTFGLLIVNADLAFFGLVSLDLARAEYILAGALWAFVSVLMPLSGILIAFFLRTRRLPGFKLTVGRIAAILLFGVLLPLVVVDAIAGFGDAPRRSVFQLLFDIPRFKGFVGVVGNCAIILVGGFSVRASRQAWRSDPLRRSAPETLLLSLGAFITVSLLLMNLTWYAIWLYPEFPKRFGGGRKPHALVILSEPYLTHSGLPTSADGRVIGPVAVLLEADNAVSVIGYKDHSLEHRGAPYNVGAVSIERKQISGLIYLKR